MAVGRVETGITKNGQTREFARLEQIKLKFVDIYGITMPGASKVSKETLNEYVQEVLKYSMETKKYKFAETIDFQIGLKKYDPQKDKRFIDDFLMKESEVSFSSSKDFVHKFYRVFVYQFLFVFADQDLCIRFGRQKALLCCPQIRHGIWCQEL